MYSQFKSGQDFNWLKHTNVYRQTQ